MQGTVASHKQAKALAVKRSMKKQIYNTLKAIKNDIMVYYYRTTPGPWTGYHDQVFLVFFNPFRKTWG
jgi:hypothetical protein